MNHKGRKILCMALALTLAAGYPASAMQTYAAEFETIDATGEDAPAQPTLPEGFSKPLEDNNGMTLTSTTATSLVSKCDTVIDVNVQWNNASIYHASVTDTSVLKSKAFTLLFDVKQSAPSGDTAITDPRAAFNIGNKANAIHVLTYSGKLGYGADGSSGGVAKNMTTLSGVAKDDWNAVALTYEETDNGNGHIIVYVNGEKSAEVTDIGFKLSTMNDLSAMIARSFNTNYLQEGRYDNIVIGDSVLDEATAIAETTYRKYVKDNLPVNTAYLEKYVAEAENWEASGVTSEELKSALAAAKALLSESLDTSRQSEIDNAASALSNALSVTVPETITINGSDVDTAAKNINGLTYKGFGMLNGNSTSNLLLEYKDKAPDKYNQMMEYLFGGEYPLFTHIKMEMGNDGNNSTGAESCTMRYEDEEADASRSPGFVMAADAKKINPDVKISILRWEMPNWVRDKWSKNTNNEGYEALYKWYKETIFDAYEKYGYVVDFVDPDKNETGDPDEAFIKWYKNRVANETDFPGYFTEEAKEKYKNIRIIASDENKGLKIVPSMRADSELYDAVDIIGFHYRTNATDDYVKMADVDDKEVWYSEGCATFGYTELQENKTTEYGYESIGGYQSPLALMDSFITAFDSSRRTHYMFQPAIGAFYEGIQYGHKELLSVRDPWSGYIHYDPALYMLEHFAKFAKTGWEDSNPDTNDIWRVITSATEGAFAGSDNEHATAGIDGNAGYMTLAAPDKSDFSVVFVNNTQNRKSFFIKENDLTLTTDTLNLWVTETDSYLQNKGPIEKANGGWTVTLPAYSIATATTLNTVPERTPQEDIHNEDRTVLDTDGTGGVNGVTDDHVLYADNFEYAEESSDFLAKRGNEPRYMLDTHGAWIVENGKLKQEISSSLNQWNPGEPSTIVGDFRWMDTLTSVDVEIPDAKASTVARLTVRAQNGMNWNNSGYTLCISGDGKWELCRIGDKVASGAVTATSDGKYSIKMLAFSDTISISINGEAVINYQDAAPMHSGRVKLSSTWDQVYFNNLLVENVAGGIPYATTMVDGQDDCVTYEGTWSITNPGGGSADNWYRTISTATASAANVKPSFTFPINGSGFAIIGKNDASAILNVYVDGTLLYENASTFAAPTRGETFMAADLDNGKHTIKVELVKGTLNIDALYTLGSRLTANEDFLKSVTTTLPTIDAVKAGDTINIKDLPDTVRVETFFGNYVDKPITWDLSEDTFAGKEFDSAYIKGTVQDGTTALGLPLTVTVPVEMAVPAKTYYFIDSVDAAPKADATTEAFEAVKNLAGDTLLNDVSDQLKTKNNTWGLVDADAGSKGYTSTADKTATGLYGKNNKVGETLSYALTLPAGSYTLRSAHREWWGMTRPMTATLSYGDTTIDAGDINLSGSSGDIINSVTFVLKQEELVTYTLTSTGSEAPVISWLAVYHTHAYQNYKDNGDGTHTASCVLSDSSITEAHTFKNGTCICGAKEKSSTPEHTHRYTYKDNGNGTHTAACKDNDSSVTENHSYVNGVCICGAVQKTDSKTDTPATPVLTVPTEDMALSQNTDLPGKNAQESKNSNFQTLCARVSKSTKNANKIQWNKQADASGYIVYGNLSGKKNTYQVLAILDNNKTTSYTHKSLKKGTYYKYIVSAYKMADGNLEILSTSKSIYAATSGGKYGNITSIKAKSKVSLKAKKKVTLKVTTKKSAKKMTSFRKLSFESSNPKIAAVSSKGVIKAKKKGTCTIYIYAQNGICKKVTVKVK